jgi:hypothetical protein
MDLKLRRLQFVRGFTNRQEDRGSGSLRTRPVPRTVPVHRNALPVPPTTSPGTQNGLASLRRSNGISSPDFPSSHPSIFPPPRASRPFCARLRPEVRGMFRRGPFRRPTRHRYRLRHRPGPQPRRSSISQHGQRQHHRPRRIPAQNHLRRRRQELAMRFSRPQQTGALRRQPYSPR